MFSEAQGFILVYSVVYRSTFELVESFYQSLRSVKGDNPIFMLVGNQCDMTRDRRVSKAEGAALASQYGCDFIETSAKTTQNVERLFIIIVRLLRQTRQISDTKSKQEPRQSAKKERKTCDCIIV
jgi:GTPase KRas protein